MTGLDASKFGITKEFYDILGKVNYEVFINLACNSFLLLRKHADELINFTCLAFSYVIDYNVIKAHMRRRLKLEKTEDEAREWLTKKLQNAPKAWKTKAKNATHKLATANLKRKIAAKMSASPPT